MLSVVACSLGGLLDRGILIQQDSSRQPSFVLSAYTNVYSVTYDSGSVPRRAIFFPLGTSPGCLPQFRPSFVGEYTFSLDPEREDSLVEKSPRPLMA
jgi:hypothetical protein